MQLQRVNVLPCVEQIHLKAAFKMFNKKPRTGIEFLQQKGVIESEGENTAVSIANWLAAYPDDLDKTQIGDYLGDERFDLNTTWHDMTWHHITSHHIT